MLRSIETVYDGYRFRSRLEARWAMCFKNLGIDYSYELEGFELPSGRYLPDFEFWGFYGEVKPERPNTRELVVARELAAASGRGVIFLIGRPKAATVYWESTPDGGWADHMLFSQYAVVEGRPFSYLGLGSLGDPPMPVQLDRDEWWCPADVETAVATACKFRFWNRHEHR